MRIGQTVENVCHDLGSQVFHFAANQPVTHSDQIITHIDRCRGTVFAMQRFLAVAELVIIFHIVVYQRRFVKSFDRESRPFDRIRHSGHFLCAFGRSRRELLVYRNAIDPDDMKLLEDHFEENLLELGEEDAQRYAANSFTYERDGDCFLFMPKGVSELLQDQIRDRGVTPVTVDVSEFLKKGGGSVKCMIGDLGKIA